MKHSLRALRVSVQFLTRVPVPGGDQPATTQDLRRAALFFPLVGTLIGLVTASAVWGAAILWPAWLAAVIGLAVEARLTGGFHEDAVADFFDAFGGGWTRDDVLRILKDSRIGSFGALALILAILMRIGAIATVAPLGAPLLFAALAASAGLGRWVILIQMALLPPPTGQSSLARDIGQQLGLRDVAIGALWALPGTVALCWLAPFQGLLALIFLVVLTLVFHRTLKRRLGGATGDCLGCLCYLAQIAVLLAAAARMPVP
ncbi:MAG: adenosylcobinamide-GDP ribazoletransferase [Acidobacteriota bacterium]